MDQLRIGIIGCGGIANGKHLPSLHLMEKRGLCHLVAFCDLVEERARKAAAEYGVENASVYTEYRELLERKDIDVVHVLTPNISHAEISIAALRAGKHVMCEKPMAKTYAEAKAMVDAARETGKKLTIGYQGRFFKEHLYLKQLIEDGVLGDIYYARSVSTRRRGVPTWGVFQDKEKQGGGPLIDIATHSLDQTLWFMDNYEPERVLGVTYHKLNVPHSANEWGPWDPAKMNVEDSAFALVKMKNGATISIESSWALNMTVPNNHVLCGTKGGADIQGDKVHVNYDCNGTFADTLYAPNQYSIPLARGENLFGQELECRQWLESVLNDTQPVTRPEQAAVVSEILEGIYISAETGKEYIF